MEPEEQIGSILFKIHCDEEISPEENAAIVNWTSQSTGNMLSYRELLNEDQLFEETRAMLRTNEENSWNVISREITQKGRIHIRKVKRLLTYVVAASVIVIISIWIHKSFFVTSNKMPALDVNTYKMQTSKWGKKALLTLSNGQVVELEGNEPDVILEKGNIKVVKTGNQQLIYRSEGANAGEYFFNTLTTLRGMEYSLVLPDGSKVWLSAATSLRYPSTFFGGQRIVELIGEAYFEIAHSSQYPFKVVVPSWQYEGPRTEIEVLGTQFDIRAYSDEMRVQTTVFEGSVKVSKGSLVSVLLHSGERVTLDSSTQQPKIHRIFPYDAISWKNEGRIYFKGDIKSIMQQLSKWFDFDVTYKEPIPTLHMFGSVFKKMDFTLVMKALGMSGKGFHYTLEGKKLTILP
jgi:transmembrane sensor